MTPDFDLIVIGAGPAGCQSGLAASRHGLSVLLVDEAADAGGQVDRAPASGLLMKLAEHGENGHELRRRVINSAITLRCGCRVWPLGPATSTRKPSETDHTRQPQRSVIAELITRRLSS